MNTEKPMLNPAVWLLIGCCLCLSSAYAGGGDNRQYAVKCLSDFRSYEVQYERNISDQRSLATEHQELATRREQIERNSQRLLREGREVTNCNTRDPECMARIHAHDELTAAHNENNRRMRADQEDLAERIEEFNVRRENLDWFEERAIASCTKPELESVSYHTWQNLCESREIVPELFERVVERRYPCW